MQKNEVRLLSYITYMNQLKMHQKSKTIKLLEENRNKLHDGGFGSGLLYMTAKAQTTKENNPELDFFKSLGIKGH